MSKKKELKRLRARVEKLEQDLAALRSETPRQVHIYKETVPAAPGVGPWPPQITCSTGPIDTEALIRQINRHARQRGAAGIN